MEGNSTTATIGKTDIQTPLITVTAPVIASTVGGGSAHVNIQPVIACYYIMFIP